MSTMRSLLVRQIMNPALTFAILAGVTLLTCDEGSEKFGKTRREESTNVELVRETKVQASLVTDHAVDYFPNEHDMGFGSPIGRKPSKAVRGSLQVIVIALTFFALFSLIKSLLSPL